MAGDRKLNVIIAGDASGAQTALRNLAGATATTATQAESSGKRISGAFGSMFGQLNQSGVLGPFSQQIGMAQHALDLLGETGSTVGKKLMGAGGAALATGGALSAMASGDIQAEASLKAAIQSTGQSYDEYEGKIRRAAATQVGFGHTNKDTQNALATLTLSLGDTDQALDRMQLVADLAAKKHIGLADAASIVAKVHGGATRVFKEFDIQVGENADGTKNLDGALDQLSAKLQGQASASVEGFGGKVKIATAWVENHVAAIGEKYGPALMGLGGALTGVGAIMEIAAGIQGKLRAAHALAAAAALEQAAAEDAAAVSNGLLAMSGQAATAVAEEQTVANVGLMASLGPLVVIAGALAIAYLGITQKGEAVTVNMKAMASATDDQLLSMYHAVQTAFGGTELPDFIEKLKNGGTEGVGSLVRLRDAIQATGGDTKALDQAISDARASQAQANETTDAATRSQDAAAQATKDFVASLDDESKALKASMDPLFGAIDATQKVYDSQVAAAGAQDKLNVAIATYGPNSKEAADAQVNLTKANYDAVHAAEGFDVSVKALESSVQSGATSIGGATDQLKTWVQQGLLTQAQADQVTTSFLAVYNEAGALDGRNVNLSITVDTQEATAALNNFGVRFARHAAGGVFTRPHLGLVAEAGPEAIIPLSNPARAAQVMAQAGLGGGGGGAVTITFMPGAIVSNDPADAARQVGVALETWFRNGGRPGQHTVSGLKTAVA